MSLVKSNRIFSFLAVAGLAAVASAIEPTSVGAGSGIAGARYATDAYPGFDNEDEMVKPERKEPRWFSFITGPTRGNAQDQMAYCDELIQEGDYSKARRQLDALVREWPTSPEAPKAQESLAALCYEQLKDYEDAFEEYRYLLDFYSLQCDYARVSDLLYQIAGILKLEGREIMFIRFENTVDVRRAYETCVLRAPGAKWVPDAMLIIGSLREAEGKPEEAIKVYENLRNLHPDSEEAKTALLKESAVRMQVLRSYGYNRSRCRDTINFMTLAIRSCRPEDVSAIQERLAEAQAMCEESAYLGAKFYDSTTRTKRSAISAYERFLAEYPQSEHAEEIRQRVVELKEGEP